MPEMNKKNPSILDLVKEQLKIDALLGPYPLFGPLMRQNNLNDLRDKAQSRKNLNVPSVQEMLDAISNAIGSGTGPGGTVDMTKLLQVANNLSELATDPAKAAAARLNLATIYRPEYDGMEGWEALKARAPAYDGERIYLKYHTKKSGSYGNNYRGGGFFIGWKKTRADDGGFTCSSGGNYYWERDIGNIANLTVDDFGATGDGVTDDKAAFIRMYDFANSTLATNLSGDNARRQGIVTTASAYALSNMDFSKRESAAATSSGYKGSAEFAIRSQVVAHMGNHAASTLIMLPSDTTPLILANHARVTFHGIKILDNKNKAFFNSNRDSTTFRLANCTMQEPNATAPSKKPFFKNVYDGGQYFNASSILIQYTGGVVFDLKDTIGSRVTELNSYMTAEFVIDTGWSDQAERSWDHPTDFELSRCNFQYPLSHPFRFARMCQGVLSNVWIEHGAGAGDFNNSQWILNGLSIEDCKTNAIGWKSRLVLAQNSLPTGNIIDMDTAPYLADGTTPNPSWTSKYTNPNGTTNPDGTPNAPGAPVNQWLSNYEMGWVRFEAAFSQLKNATTINYLTGAMHGDNLAGSARWFKVGTMETRNLGGEWHFAVEATKGYSALKIGTAANYLDNQAPGKCYLDVQRPADGSGSLNGYKFTMSMENQSGVADAALITLSSTTCELWVQLAAFCGGFSVHVTGSGSTRNEKGICDRFVPGDGVFTTTAPAATGSQVLARPQRMHFWGDGTVGFGYTGGMLTRQTVLMTDAEMDTIYWPKPSRGAWEMVNNYKQPVVAYYGIKPKFTTNLAATATVATGGTLTLTAAGSDIYSWQWYKNGVAIAGATAATYTKANVTSADAGNYYVVGIGRPSENTLQSAVTAVTIS